MNLLIMVSFILTGLLFVGISIPLILRKIPPNAIYGFRIHKTLANPDIWYKANEYAGKQLAIMGTVIILSSVGLGLLGVPVYVYPILMLLVMTVSGVTAVIISLIYVNTL